MPVTTANTQSSASTRSDDPLTDLFSDKALNFCLKHATLHDSQDGKPADPRENNAVALWEDLYHKRLLKGYSNNSQVPPHNQSDKAIDIVTFYFANTSDGLRKIALLFTEAKRESVAKTGKNLWEAENQLYGYCDSWLRARRPKESANHIYGNVVVGRYIRCFLATLTFGASNQKIIKLIDVHFTPTPDGPKTEIWSRTEKDSNISLYLDISNVKDGHQQKILDHFRTIRRSHDPQLTVNPSPGPSRPGSSRSMSSLSAFSSQAERTSTTGSPARDGSPMKVDNGGFSKRPVTPTQTAGNTYPRGSPMDIDNNGFRHRSSATGSGQPYAVGNKDRRSQSPQNDSARQPNRQRTPLREDSEGL